MMDMLPVKSYSRINVQLPLPNLIEVQLESFERLKAEGLEDLFHEISPIESYNGGMRLYFPGRSPEAEQWSLTYWFDKSKYSMEECIDRDLTYSKPLYVSVLLAGPEIAEPIKQEIFLGDFARLILSKTNRCSSLSDFVESKITRFSSNLIFFCRYKSIRSVPITTKCIAETEPERIPPFSG